MRAKRRWYCCACLEEPSIAGKPSLGQLVDERADLTDVVHQLCCCGCPRWRCACRWHVQVGPSAFVPRLEIAGVMRRAASPRGREDRHGPVACAAGPDREARSCGCRALPSSPKRSPMMENRAVSSATGAGVHRRRSSQPGRTRTRMPLSRPSSRPRTAPRGRWAGALDQVGEARVDGRLESACLAAVAGPRSPSR